MIVVPAIDVRRGRVVRLRQGRAQDETVYGQDPAEVARRWESEGARRIHLVDLDAAIDGLSQAEAVGAVVRAARVPVEVGGGLRSLEEAERSLQRMATLAPRILCKGHYGAIEGRDAVKQHLGKGHQSLKDFPASMSGKARRSRIC